MCSPFLEIRDPHCSARNEALGRYRILDTEREEDFDDICRLASRICHTPIATVSFIDSEDRRKWFKSEIGLGIRELPIEEPQFLETILENETLVINDTDKDGRLSSDPLFSGAWNLHFYAGAVIRTPDGIPIGTVAVMDHYPRKIHASKIEALRVLARQVMTMLELRRRVAEEQANAKMLRESEERLRVSDLRHRALTHAVADIIWTTVSDGHMRGEQSSWTRFTGQPTDELQGEGWAAAIHPDDRLPTLDAWRRCVRQQAEFDFEHRIRRTDGKWRICRARAVPVFENGRVREWAGVHTDITDVRMADEKLREALEAETRANSAKDEFLAKLSHELRTPLTPVLMTAGDLLEQADLSEEVREDLRTIMRNAELEARLIDDLLDVTRIVHGKLELRLEECDLHRLLEHALEICAPTIRQKQILVSLQFEATASVVRGDPTRLQQVFWNLLTNAAKFVSRAGRIDISTTDHPENRTVQVVVRDNGIGIEKNRAGSLFDVFEQGGQSFTRRFGGLGLGLAICKGIVEAHNGHIWAESDGLGRGTSFALELPITPKPLPVIPSTEPAQVLEAQTSGLAILLVEDHVPSAEIMIRLMRRSGHRVEHATSIRQAREMAEKTAFDFVLSDLGLPDGSGLELMSDLRDQYGLRGIALSGYGTHADVAASRAAGFVEHLIKPIDWKVLAAVISDHSKRVGSR
ncbi:MAG TPA: ATP-binding protein [Chthoniobacterales bacterium]